MTVKKYSYFIIGTLLNISLELSLIWETNSKEMPSHVFIEKSRKIFSSWRLLYVVCSRIMVNTLHGGKENSRRQIQKQKSIYFKSEERWSRGTCFSRGATIVAAFSVVVVIVRQKMLKFYYQGTAGATPLPRRISWLCPHGDIQGALYFAFVCPCGRLSVTLQGYTLFDSATPCLTSLQWRHHCVLKTQFL